MKIIYTENEYSVDLIDLPAFSVSAILRDQGYDEIESLEELASVESITHKINQEVDGITIFELIYQGHYTKSFIGPTKNFLKDR